MDNMNTEQLIELVRLNRPLWNKKCKDYHNRTLVKKLWEQVAEEMDESCSAIKLKWRYLRDNFRRELIKVHKGLSGNEEAAKKSKWIYFDDLSFLSDSGNILFLKGYDNENDCDTISIVDTENSNNSDPLKQDEFADDENIEVFIKEEDELTNENLCVMDNQKRKNENNINFQPKIIKTEHTFENTTENTKLNSNTVDLNDGSYYFFMSLLPQMRRLPLDKNLQMRIKILQLFIDEEK